MNTQYLTLNTQNPKPNTYSPVRLAHIITGLNTGGAEMMLYKLLSRLDRQRFTLAVWCLTDDGPTAEKIRALGIPVSCVAMRRGLPDFSRFARLARELRAFRPDIAQTWLYHADVVGGLAARLAGVPRVVWNIRNSVYNPAYARKTTVLMGYLAAGLSHFVPDAILSCSDVARSEHIALGYATRKIRVMPNGFDIAAFRPDPQARLSVREELGVSATTLLVGMVARYDPAKDHANFFEAAARIRQRFPDVVFVCCGDGVTPDNPAIAAQLSQWQMTDSVRLLGRRSDMPRLNAAFDIAVSSSRYGEGFPNVIGEAMACAVPCVVTRSGDAPFVVGDTGLVVPPAQPEHLTQAVCRLLDLSSEERSALGLAARQRIVEQFDLNVIAARYAQFYTDLKYTKEDSRREKESIRQLLSHVSPFASGFRNTSAPLSDRAVDSFLLRPSLENR